MGYVMKRRQRSNHTLTFEERLKQQAERLRHEREDYLSARSASSC
jgi:hypothetical protein